MNLVTDQAFQVAKTPFGFQLLQKGPCKLKLKLDSLLSLSIVTLPGAIKTLFGKKNQK